MMPQNYRLRFYYRAIIVIDERTRECAGDFKSPNALTAARNVRKMLNSTWKAKVIWLEIPHVDDEGCVAQIPIIQVGSKRYNVDNPAITLPNDTNDTPFAFTDYDLDDWKKDGARGWRGRSSTVYPRFERLDEDDIEKWGTLVKFEFSHPKIMMKESKT